MLRHFSAIVCCLGLWSTAAQAAVLYDSGGFESPTFSVGALNGQDAWIGGVPSGSNGAIEIQTNVVESGAQALELDSSGERVIARRVVVTDDEFWVHFDARPPAQDDISANPVLNFRNGNGGTIYLTISFIGGSGLINNLPNANYLFEEWNDVVVRVELPTVDNGNTGSYDLYIGEQLVAQGQSLPGTVDTSVVSQRTFDFDWQSQGDGTTSFYIDNFLVSDENPIPEPGAAALISAGAYLVLFRRSNHVKK